MGGLITREIAFDSNAHTADAIQRAAYRFSDRLSIDLHVCGDVFNCSIHVAAEPAEEVDSLLAEFRNEVLDQVLRERIRRDRGRAERGPCARVLEHRADLESGCRASQPAEAYLPEAPSWELLPFRFERIGRRRVLLTNMVGEHLFVIRRDFAELAEERPAGRLAARPAAARPSTSSARPARTLPLELLALKTRTRYDRLAPDSPGCTSSSSRCAASTPARTARSRGRARTRAASTCPRRPRDAALELAFRSPSPHIKIEFQGGEPLLNFPLIEADRR